MPLPAGFPLSAKLIFGFLLVTIPSLTVMVVISFYAQWKLASVNHQLQEISRSLEAVQGLETAVARTMTPLSAHLVNGASAEDHRFRTAIDDVEDRLKSCSDAGCHGTSRQPKAMAQELAPYVLGIKDRAATIFGSGGPQAAQARIRALHEASQQGEEANRRLERMSSTLIQRVAALQGESQAVSLRAEILVLSTVVLVLVLAALSAYLLSRRLLRHVTELLTGTRQLMRGNLRYRVAISERDEIGQLAQSFNAMAKEIQQHRDHMEKLVEAKTAELRRAQDSLVQSEKLASVGLLASGVAHELNNPLTSILMNVNLLAEEPDDRPALKAELRRIGEDALRCKRIIDDLRDFSRPHELQRVPSDLNRLVGDALVSLSRTIELHRIDVVPRLSPEMPLVPCDPGRMEQVLANVLLNAAQAMSGGGTLTLKTALRAGFAQISVSDTGPGIPSGLRGRIFDPFFTTKPQGTGLGLSIVYRIMQAHGGRVEVESATREEAEADSVRPAGTTVLLFLPLSARDSGTEVPAGQ